MRISITDRCNLRCRYCMPNGITLVPMECILTYEELVMVCEAAAQAGIRRLKVTGGEPLARRGCAALVGRLKRIPGIEEVTLTTNGKLLGRFWPELLRSGLDAVNISLDTLRPETYRRITGKDCFADVWEGLCRALSSGVRVKVNSVLMEGINEMEWPQLAELTEKMDVDVRFIEMMPIGYGRKFQAVSNEKVLAGLRTQHPDLQKDDRPHGNGPAVYYRIPGAAGSIGFISAVHGNFCAGCNRIRLTSQGKLKPCLCYEEGIDLRAILRGKRMQEEDIREAVLDAVLRKPRGHQFAIAGGVTEQHGMAQIGG